MSIDNFFPLPPSLKESKSPPQAKYMSKRDYIATQIVAGIMANPSLCREGHEFMVRAAYKLADAMIRESKR